MHIEQVVFIDVHFTVNSSSVTTTVVGDVRAAKSGKDGDNNKETARKLAPEGRAVREWRG